MSKYQSAFRIETIEIHAKYKFVKAIESTGRESTDGFLSVSLMEYSSSMNITSLITKSDTNAKETCTDRPNLYEQPLTAKTEENNL